MRKIISRIKGGLGNQLFCYAAARRLALVNNAELVLDNVTGFGRDLQYSRKFALDHFNIPVRKASPAERLEPFERYRRGIMKWVSRRKPFADRHYLEQEGLDFDERLLTLQVNGTLYLDGYWQSEDYFKDVEQTMHEDLRIILPTDSLSLRLAEKIRASNALAIHVRWFDPPGGTATHNISADYYKRAIALMECKVESPHYFLFSDDPDAAFAMLSLPKGRVTIVSQARRDKAFHNRGFNEKAIADLWLMIQCQHFITANSTFSWWGAWLGGGKEKIVVTPGKLPGKITAWGFKGQIPSSWLQL